MTRAPSLLLLVGISALGPIVLNGVIPANSQIIRDLDSSYSAAQLILTIYLLAIMIAQIVLGNWADRYGRRPVMIGSLIVFALGGLICATAQAMEVLLIGRFIQGLGSSVCMFLPRTIVRDIYPRDKSASVIGYMTTAMMAAPLFGPALGGWITDISTWRFLYALLAILGFLFAGLAWVFQHETLREAQIRPVGSRFFDASKVLLSSRLYVAYLLVQVGSVGAYYTFLAGAPYILMELRSLSASQYGLWFMVVAIGYLLGNLTAGRLSSRLGVHRMITLALIPGMFGILLFWLLSGWSHPLGLFIPMQIVAFSNGMCLPNVMSATMSVRPELSGSASGLAGTVQTFVGIVLTLLVSLFLIQSTLPFYLLLSFSAFIALVGYYWLFNINKQTDGQAGL